jgi:predicted O-methyltransferase YrrM
MATNQSAAACKVAETILGWLAPEEAEYLYHLGFNSRGNILEIGTYFGKSTYLIARGIRDAGKDHRVVTLDIHSRGVDPATGKTLILAEDSPASLLRMFKVEGLENHVIQIIGWSHQVIPMLDLDSFEAVFIDGGHEYEPCSKDFLSVRSRARRRLRLQFHDYGPYFPGVQRTIDELVRTDPCVRVIRQIQSLFICDLFPSEQAKAAA